MVSKFGTFYNISFTNINKYNIIHVSKILKIIYLSFSLHVTQLKLHLVIINVIDKVIMFRNGLWKM